VLAASQRRFRVLNALAFSDIHFINDRYVPEGSAADLAGYRASAASYALPHYFI
jgi:hypothetical protein